jgi:hypothetical protein
MKGMWHVSNAGTGAKDVGIRNRRVVSLLSETRGVREVSAAGDGNGVRRSFRIQASPPPRSLIVCMMH